MFKLVIFDFDGTLFDSFDAINHCMQRTFDALLPSHTPSPVELRRLISIGTTPGSTFQTLQPDREVLIDEAKWVSKYRELYAIHGQPLTKPFPGARDIVVAIQERKIPVAIISNKSVAAVKTALERSDLHGLFPESLIIGDNMFGDKKKPHPAGYNDLLLPRLRAVHGEDFLDQEGEILMVGDTITDILFARNIGGQICWCRYGQGNVEECENSQPNFTIDALTDIMRVVEGL